MSYELTDSVIADMARTCVCRQARMAARKISRAYDEALRPAGLKATQFTVLVAVRYGVPESITTLADWLAMERTSLTRNLQLLEKAGLIRLGPHGGRRARGIELTDAGRDKLSQAYPLWEAAQARMREHLGDEHLQQASEALRRLARVG